MLTEVAVPKLPALTVKTSEMSALVKEGSVPPTIRRKARSSADENSAKSE